MSKKTDQPNPAPQATAPATVPTTPKKTFQEFVGSPKFQAELANALPKHLTVERYIRVLMTATIRTPLLLQCTQESLFAGIFTAAQAGLEIDGRDAHLIPFRNGKKGGIYEAQLVPDYKGLAKLVMQSGLVASIHSDVVCDGDEFEYDKGLVIKHRIDLRKARGEPYAAYCIIRFKDGGEKCEVMNAYEINAVRARSRSAESGPWVTDPNEMWKKTVFKRAQKWVPVSPEIRQVMDAEDRAEPLNVTPKQTFAGLIGAPEAPQVPPDAAPLPPKPEVPPVEVPSYTDEQRAVILKETQSLMLDLGVSESKVMLYVHANGLGVEGCDEVATLPTHVLDGLRAVIPTLAVKKEGKP